MANAVADMLLMQLPDTLKPTRTGMFLWFGRSLNLSVGARVVDDPQQEYAMRQLILSQADLWTRQQSDFKVDIHWRAIEATVTDNPKIVGSWPLPHDCDECRDGITKAKAAAESGHWVILCRLEYDEG